MRRGFHGKAVVALGAWLAALLVVALVLGVGSAAASEPIRSCGDGGGYFPSITGPSAPEEYPCEVRLGEEQFLRAVDEQHAEVYESGHVPAYEIAAEAAHDAVGTNVPTTLRVDGRNVVTLVVHYLEGNPTAGGAPFTYPIVGGVGWEGGFRTVVVPMDNRSPAEASSPQETSAPAPVVLGGKAFAPNGAGWGTERPTEIFNGGDPSGLITDVRWQSWGGKVATGWGKNAIFKPHGGYYRRPVAIELRASHIGTCEGRRAYLRLKVREPSRPGGPLGPWRSWSGASTICSAPARR